MTQCVVNDRSIIYRTLNAPDQVIITLSSITICDVGKVPGNHRYFVRIESAQHGRVYLFPANSFDPRFIFYLNKSEAEALSETINSFRVAQKPRLNSNPYYRQLDRKDTPTRVKSVSENWDPNISPWVYFHKYEDSFELLKYFFSTLLGAFLGTGLIMLIAYVLDLYGII